MASRKIPVHAAHDEMRKTAELVPNPRNPNTHSDAQIALLAKIIEAQGWRAPITVSSRSGFVVRGHGRLAAALLLGLPEVPVDVQDYKDEAAEWADLVADNRLAELAEIDNLGLRDLLTDLKNTPGFDLSLAGFSDLEYDRLFAALAPADPFAEWEGMPEYTNADLRHKYQLIVSFETPEEKVAFGEMIGQHITDKTPSIHYPPVEWERFADKGVRSTAEDPE